MDGAWGAPMDGSSVSAAPNLRHPYTIRSRPTKFRADEQRHDTLERYRFS